MNRPYHAVTVLVAAMTAVAYLVSASHETPRSAALVRLQPRPMKASPPSERSLRLQAMQRLMTPVETIVTVRPTPQVVPVTLDQVSALPEIGFESSCGLDRTTGEIYELRAAAEAVLADVAREAKPLKVSASTVRLSSAAPPRRTVTIYRTPSAVRSPAPAASYPRPQFPFAMRADLMPDWKVAGLGDWRTWLVSAAEWLRSAPSCWGQPLLTDEFAAATPDQESRVVPRDHSVLRNRTTR